MTNSLNPSRSQERLVKIDGNDPRAVAQARAAIALLYAVDSNSRKTPLHVLRRNRRFRELETALAFNHRGPVLSEDDAGRDDLFIVACHLLKMRRKNPIAAFQAWAEQWAPWCSRQQLETIMQSAAADNRRWTADELAKALGLTFQHRMDLGITTIGAIDCDKNQRKQRRAANSQKRSEARRRKMGAKPRAASAARTKPWKEQDISRSTYQRRKAKAKQSDTIPNTPIEGEILVRSHLCHDDLARLPVGLRVGSAALRPPWPWPMSAAPKARARQPVERHSTPYPQTTE